MSAAKKKLNTDQVASELSESAFFQPQTTNPQVGKTTSTQMDKPAKPLVEKYTTHLHPETIKAIRIYAAQHDMKDYEVAQMAFDLLLQEDEARPVEKKQETLSRAEVEATLPLPDDLVTLQAFADQHFLIEKADKGGRTRTSIRRMEEAERAREVARMLSGAKLTDTSLEHARNLLESSR